MTLDELRGFTDLYAFPLRGGCGRDERCYRCWECEKEDRERGTGVHESVFRSYQVLKKVEEWLEAGAPPSVVLEMIRFAYDRDKPQAIHIPASPAVWGGQSK